MLALQRPPQERRQIPSVEIFVWRFSHGVVAAGEYRNLVVEVVALEFSDYLARKFRQKGQIVLRVDDQRFPLPAGELLEVRHRAYAEPQRAQAVNIQLRLQPLSDVARRLAVPDNVSDVGGSVIECGDLDA